jgi:hypothetical protein
MDSLRSTAPPFKTDEQKYLEPIDAFVANQEIGRPDPFEDSLHLHAPHYEWGIDFLEEGNYEQAEIHFGLAAKRADDLRYPLAMKAFAAMKFTKYEFEICCEILNELLQEYPYDWKARRYLEYAEAAKAAGAFTIPVPAILSTAHNSPAQPIDRTYLVEIGLELRETEKDTMILDWARVQRYREFLCVAIDSQVLVECSIHSIGNELVRLGEENRELMYVKFLGHYILHDWPEAEAALDSCDVVYPEECDAFELWRCQLCVNQGRKSRARRGLDILQCNYEWHPMAWGLRRERPMVYNTPPPIGMR